MAEPSDPPQIRRTQNVVLRVEAKPRPAAASRRLRRRSQVLALKALFLDGHARVPETWDFAGPERMGLWWRAGQEVVGTPLLLRLAAHMPSDGERVGLLLATEARLRGPWLDIIAVRLGELGAQGRLEELCRQIFLLGAAAAELRSRVAGATIAASEHASMELAVWGAPVDQPAAAPGLVRALGQTAALIEGEQGRAVRALRPVDPLEPDGGWTSGRLVQAPGASGGAGQAVLSGAVPPCATPADGAGRMTWVLQTPWVTLLAVLAFTAEAWAAERQGGVALELPGRLVEQLAQPPRLDVVVTLADGQEVLCGSLGELCLRVIDALGMAVVPAIDAGELDRRLGPVVAELLRCGVWRFVTDGRIRYVLGEGFGYDCYRGQGHRSIFRGAEALSRTLRGVAVSWAKARIEQAGRAREVGA